MIRLRNNNGTKSSTCSLYQLIIYILLSSTSYYIGYITSISSSPCSSSTQLFNQDQDSLEQQLFNVKSNYDKGQAEIKLLHEQLRQKEQDFQHKSETLMNKLDKIMKEKEELNLKVSRLQITNATKSEGISNGNQKEYEEGGGKSSTSAQPRFVEKSIFKGMAYTPKREFMSTYDFGSPIDSPFTSDVLLLYSPTAIPNDITDEQKLSITTSSSDDVPKFKDPIKATNNCNIMHVVTIPTNGETKNVCLAIVPNYMNQLTQKWMRPKKDPKNKLEIATRGQTEESRVFIPPGESDISKHWETLRTYFNTIDDVLKELKPVAESVAKDNTIILMTCNMGQSELLINFVCNARAKGLDAENILVFPTDGETKELAEALGLTTFHDEKVGAFHDNIFCVPCHTM